MNCSTAAVYVIHKPFMIVTKYCDMVLEPSAGAAGLNFYERGLNLAKANLVTTIMPVILNLARWTGFQSAFVRVVQERTPVAFRDIVRFAELICSPFENRGVYVLQSRAGAGTSADDVEGPLGDAFRRAARVFGLPEAVRRKYEASLSVVRVSRTPPLETKAKAADNCRHFTSRSTVRRHCRPRTVNTRVTLGNIGDRGVLAVLGES